MSNRVPEVENLLDLLSIPGKSGEETNVLDTIKTKLNEASFPGQIVFDQAHERAGFGQTGNLIATLNGNIEGPRCLLMAHVDTVPLCEGAKPVVDGEWISSESPETALGGDDRAGASVVLSTALRIIKEKPKHPPITFLWTVQEEIGLVGARYVDTELLLQPERCINFDGGSPAAVIRGATGDSHIDIHIRGIASHAGAHPEKGVSAISIAAVAIADLQQRGWLGLVTQPDGVGTSNLGSIQGGAATNVVTDRLVIHAEARSHNPEFRAKIVSEIQQAFEAAAAAITNDAGETGSIEFGSRNKYDSFAIDADSPLVLQTMDSIRKAGLEPEERISNGGLDANWMTANGLPTVTLGCGQEAIHTVNERLHIPSYLQACSIAWDLVTE